MTREEVLALLRDHEADLAAYSVSSLALFGSVARGEAKPESDVDLLVEFLPGSHVGAFEFLALQRYLESLLGHRVDLVTRAALRRGMGDEILREAIDVAA